MSDTLPAPRALLTSLVNTLTSQPIPPAEQQQQHHQQSASSTSTSRHNRHPQEPTNPLSLLPSSSRTLLTTLHVIYPSLLLPALDLLDRGLVTRVLILGAPSTPLDEAEQARLDARASTFHLVRSAQQQSARGRGRGGRRSGFGLPASGKTYMVHTSAWNCDCAAFAFSAFPAREQQQQQQPGAGYHVSPCRGHRPGRQSAAGSWEFGGLSLDGREKEHGGVGSGVPPCCKHLLACVLAERWGAVLGSYVNERLVSREEAAGLVGSL